MMKNGHYKKAWVSVIMPVRNGSFFVAQAIESILSQTYKNFELIIVNDHSRDNTFAIIEKYRQSYPKKIKVIHLTKRRGAYGATNVAMSQAKGEFIALMDSDDVSHPKRLEKQVEFLLQNKDVIIVGTQARIIDRDGNIIGVKTFPTDHKEIYQKFFEVFPIVHPSCLIRRDLLPKKNRLYKNKFGINDDYFTFFTLLKHGKFHNLPEYLFDYRIHSGNSSLKSLKQNFYNTIKIRLVAVTKYNFKPTLGDLIKFLCQILLVTPLPESILRNIYFLIKGVHVSGESKVTLPKKLSFALGEIKDVTFSSSSPY